MPSRDVQCHFKEAPSHGKATVRVTLAPHTVQATFDAVLNQACAATGLAREQVLERRGDALQATFRSSLLRLAALSASEELRLDFVDWPVVTDMGAIAHGRVWAVTLTFFLVPSIPQGALKKASLPPPPKTPDLPWFTSVLDALAEHLALPVPEQLVRRHFVLRSNEALMETPFDVDASDLDAAFEGTRAALFAETRRGLVLAGLTRLFPPPKVGQEPTRMTGMLEARAQRDMLLHVLGAVAAELNKGAA